MEYKKKSIYQSRIESLKIQNEIESKTIKELLSPAAFEKLKKAQSALPQVSSYQAKLQNFNAFMAKELAHQAQLKKIVKKKPGKKGKKRKETIWERRINDVKNAEIKALPEEIVETVGKGPELQGIDKIEKEAGKSQSACTMKHQSLSFKIEPKEVELLGGALEEQESYELWEPKVELLEEEEDVQFPHSSNFVEKQSELKEPKEMIELPISYVSVEQLSRLVELQKKPDNIEECPFQKQISQLSPVPGEGMCGQIEMKKDTENVEEVPLYLLVDQQSNYYVLN